MGDSATPFTPLVIQPLLHFCLHSAPGTGWEPLPPPPEGSSGTDESQWYGVHQLSENLIEFPDLLRQLETLIKLPKREITPATTRDLCEKYGPADVVKSLSIALRVSPLLPDAVASAILLELAQVEDESDVIDRSRDILENVPFAQFRTFGSLCALLMRNSDQIPAFAEIVLLPGAGRAPRAEALSKLVRVSDRLFFSEEGGEVLRKRPNTVPPPIPKQGSDKGRARAAGRKRASIKHGQEQTTVEKKHASFVGVAIGFNGTKGKTPKKQASSKFGAAGLEDGETKLGRVVREIVETEEQYHAQLAAFTQYYVQALGACAAGPGGEEKVGLSREEIRVIFGALSPIVDTSSAILELLHVGMALNMGDGDENEPGKVGAVGGAFVDVAVELVASYTGYTSEHEKALKLLKNALDRPGMKLRKRRFGTLGRKNKTKKREKVQNFARQWETVSAGYACLKGHSLQSILIMPIQRIPRYRLLLTEMIKRTPDGHAGRDAAEEALVVMKEVAASINDAIKQRRKLESFFGGTEGEAEHVSSRHLTSKQSMSGNEHASADQRSNEMEAEIERNSSHAAAVRVKRVLNEQRSTRLQRDAAAIAVQ